ncbi:MAG: hypothetical protein AB8H79_03155 [Myxococcota bacterium]
MSVWKRLGNVAKGSVKTWTRGSEPGRDAALDEIEAELANASTVGRSEDRAARPRVSDAPVSASAVVREPGREPVPRTDLFGGAEDAAPKKADLFTEALEEEDPTELAPPEMPLADEAARVEDAVQAIVNEAAPESPKRTL